MPPPAFLTGVLSGFTKRAAESRIAAQREQELQDQKEIAILNTLSSADNPEISHAAITGLLDIASGQKKPKGGYLARLMGPSETNIHPAVPSLLQLIKGGVRTEIPAPTLGSMSIGPAPSPAGTLPTPPPTAGAAAMPPPPNKPGGGITPPTGGPVALPGGGVASSAQPIQVGAPPEIIPVSNTPDLRAPTGGPPLQFGSTGQAAGPPTVIRTPMQVWDTPEQKIRKAEIAKRTAEVEGSVAGWMAVGYTREQATKLAEEDLITQRRGATGFQSIFGETQDAQGNWVGITASFDRAAGVWRDVNGNALTTFRKSSTTPAGNDAGALYDEVSMLPEFGGTKYMLNTPENRTRVHAKVQQIQQQQLPYNRAFNAGLGGGQAQAQIPLSTAERWNATTTLRTQWTKAEEPRKALDATINIMEVGLARLQADPIGGVEFIRVPFAKIADNLSVVRESEFNRQTNALSALDRLVGWVQKQLDGGGNIPVEMLQEMVTTAQMVRDKQRGFNDQLGRDLDDQARRWNLNPADVRGSLAGGSPGPQVQGPPPAGPGGIGIGTRVGDEWLPAGTKILSSTDTATGEVILGALLPSGEHVQVEKIGTRYRIVR